MKNTIHAIFSDAVDDAAHYEFVKFSRGVFQNRYLIDAKKQKDMWAIKTGNEFANYFVSYFANKLGANSTDVTGIIVSTRNLKQEPGFDKTLVNVSVKQFMGVKQFQINQQLTGKEILQLISASPASFFALSFSVGGSVLKIKPKAPKSSKPGTKTKDSGEGPKADFCSLKTNDASIVEDLVFDFSEFKEIKINHTIEINEIEIPKGISDPAKMREMANRKGVMKRMITIDGKKEIKEKKFSV